VTALVSIATTFLSRWPLPLSQCLEVRVYNIREPTLHTVRALFMQYPSGTRHYRAMIRIETVVSDTNGEKYAMLCKLLIGVTLSAALSTAAFGQSKFDTLTEAKRSTIATEAASRVGRKQCRSKRPDGTVKTWTCRSDQPCCVNHFFNLYTCGSQLLQCL